MLGEGLTLFIQASPALEASPLRGGDMKTTQI